MQQHLGSLGTRLAHRLPRSTLVSLACTCLLVKEAISVTEPPRMLPESFSTASREPITPLPLSLALDPKRLELNIRIRPMDPCSWRF